MATKIGPTPILTGKKLERFLNEMKRPATKEEKESYKQAQKVYKKIKLES